MNTLECTYLAGKVSVIDLVPVAADTKPNSAL